MRAFTTVQGRGFGGGWRDGGGGGSLLVKAAAEVLFTCIGLLDVLKTSVAAYMCHRSNFPIDPLGHTSPGVYVYSVPANCEILVK